MPPAKKSGAARAKNYYLGRYNPLEENFRVYKVVEGDRSP